MAQDAGEVLPVTYDDDLREVSFGVPPDVSSEDLLTALRVMLCARGSSAVLCGSLRSVVAADNMAASSSIGWVDSNVVTSSSIDCGEASGSVGRDDDAMMRALRDQI